jgi:hypothetical protein
LTFILSLQKKLENNYNLNVAFNFLQHYIK